MTLQSILLFSTALSAGLGLYLQEVLFAPTGGSVNVSCLADSDALMKIRKFYWFRRVWKRPEALEKITDCRQSNTSEKYSCMQEDTSPLLEVNNISTLDSGVYYCAFYLRHNITFGNGTTLIARDISLPNGSIYLLAPQYSPPPYTTIQLACVVRMSLGHVTWNITGTRHKGDVISLEEPGGTWTVLGLFSLSRDTWDYGRHVTCEVWLNSSLFMVPWEIPKRGKT